MVTKKKKSIHLFCSPNVMVKKGLDFLNKALFAYFYKEKLFFFCYRLLNNLNTRNRSEKVKSTVQSTS